jgi:fluoride ion exporter CrcB/FEX
VKGEPARNGAAAAAILSACVGCFALAILAMAGDASKSMAKMLTLWRPTGPLSGVSTLAIVIWLAAWLLWHRRWGERTIAMARVTSVALVLLALGLLLTFPPFEDLLLGK